MLMEEYDDQKNKFKEQVIHTETLNMMAKYQLIFLRMESNMRKLELNIKLKVNQEKLHAFRKLQRENTLHRHQFTLLFYQIHAKFKNMDRVIRRKGRSNLIYAFQKIRFLFPKNKNDKIKKSFLQVISSKDAEIKNLIQKEHEIMDNISQQRSKEQEIQSKIKIKDQQISQLEGELKKNTTNKTLDQKLRGLEVENQEMQDKIVGTEDSVSLFIREMNDLLDSYEISTNLDSDDNASYEQQNIEYQSQRVNQNQRNAKPKNFYSNQLTRSTKLN